MPWCCSAASAKLLAAEVRNVVDGSLDVGYKPHVLISKAANLDKKAKWRVLGCNRRM